MGRQNEKNKNSEAWIIYLIVLVIVLCVGAVVAAVIYENKPEEIPVEIKATDTPQPTYTPKPTEQAAATPVPTVTPVPTATPIPMIPMHIQEYIRRNDDTVGYISIEGTVIDYPVMYSGDNEFYLKNDFNKSGSYHGAIFLDYRCNVYDMQSTRNMILYGHRMRDGTMFRPVVFYFEKKFFDEHRIIQFDTLAGEMQWEVFATFESHIDFYYIRTEFESDEEWLEFIRYCQSLSLYESDVVLNKDDIVLTLSTCSTDKNHRVVLMARLIKENRIEKPS